MDDRTPTEGFDRLIQLSGASVPPMAELEGRVLVRARRRRNRQRAVLGACAVVLVLLGLAAVANRPDGGTTQNLGSKPAPSTVPLDPTGDPVFTIARLPEDLAFRSCLPLAPDDPTVITGVSCTYDNPATAGADGLRINRVIDGATSDLRAAWDADDAAAAAVASGGADDPDAARFITLGGTKVLDLSVAGQPSNDESAALRTLVGDDLVDIGATSVPMDELGHVITGLSMEPPSQVVSQALDALPDGSVALVQGERPLWVQPDAMRPEERAPFGGDTVGTEIAVPGSERLVGVDVTTGIDADALLDGLVGAGLPELTETQLDGRRAVVLAPQGMMPITLPEPRPGPQILVALDDDVIVRVKDPDGSAALVESIAEALG